MLPEETRRQSCGVLLVWQVSQPLILPNNLGCEMEPPPENVKKMQPSVWLSLTLEKGNFFFRFLSCKSVNLFSAAKTNKLKDEDVYHMQPHKEGGYLRQNKWLWHGPGSACPTHLIDYKDSFASYGSLSLSLYEFGCGKISPNGGPK